MLVFLMTRLINVADKGSKLSFKFNSMYFENQTRSMTKRENDKYQTCVNDRKNSH